MAIVKATYTKSRDAAKATIRYIQHRPGQEGERTTRTLFTSDGAMERAEAYRMIDEAQKGSIFFRFVLSPDPRLEDQGWDLDMRAMTQTTLQTLEERLQKPLLWLAVEHADHTPHRHVHVLAVVTKRIFPQDLQQLRHSATTACLEQRRELDQVWQQREQEREEAMWGFWF
jgi:hypothetical protein